MSTSTAPYEASQGAALSTRRQDQLDRIDVLRSRHLLPAAQLDSARAVVLLGSDEPQLVQLLEDLVYAFETEDARLRVLRGEALLLSGDRTPSLALGTRVLYLTALRRRHRTDSTGPRRVRPANRSARTPARRRVITTPMSSNAPPTTRESRMPARSTSPP